MWKSNFSDEMNYKIFQVAAVLLYGCTTWILRKKVMNSARMLRSVLNQEEALERRAIVQPYFSYVNEKSTK